MNTEYSSQEPSRAEIDALTEPVVVEFGAPWCGHCQAAQPFINSALAGYPSLRHFKVEDGKGKPLGRSFQVKLWPTLVFMRNGQEVARLVRPGDVQSIRDALGTISTT